MPFYAMLKKKILLSFTKHKQTDSTIKNSKETKNNESNQSADDTVNKITLYLSIRNLQYNNNYIPMHIYVYVIFLVNSQQLMRRRKKLDKLFILYQTYHNC